MNNIKDITRLALVAALYIVLTVFNPFSYGEIQFRIAEILVLLPFFRKDYAYSIIIGCFIANLFGPYALLDAVFGTLATAISVLLIAYSKNLFIATLYPVIFNGVIVGGLIYFLTENPLPIYIIMGYVALGEFVVITVLGYLLFRTLSQNKLFIDIIDANQNIPPNLT